MRKYIQYTLIAAFILLLLLLIFTRRANSLSIGGTTVAEPLIEPQRAYGIVVDDYQLSRGEIARGEAMGHILSRYGLSSAQIYRLEQTSKPIFPLNRIKAGSAYTTFTRLDSLGVERLDHLVYEKSRTDYVVFSLVGDSISVYEGVKPVTVKRHVREAVIDHSMWGAIMEAELPYALGAEIEDIYQWTVDFFSIQRGDRFTVIYDETFVDDTVSVGLGRVWGAKFCHANREYYAIPFKQNNTLQYWEEDGASLRKQMLKAPLKYTRISSGFSYSRLHPVHKVYKPHTGVDYAAPLNTPVHSVADGVVIFKGWGGGGGNTLKIKHPGGFTTGYLHLNGFANGLAVGSTVKQGQTIGYVGSTGTSTGPHLDYRIWKGDQPINPLKLPQEPQEPISEENQELFDYVKSRIIAELNGSIDDCDRITSLDDIDLPRRDSIIVAQQAVFY